MLMLLLLLGPSSGLGALVSQDPRTAVCKSGTSVMIKCHSVGIQATTVFWYRQFPEQGLTLMATSNVDSKAAYEQGFSETEFSISHPNTTFSSLTVMSVKPADSSLYFCSASNTALGRDQRLRQEPCQQPPSSPPHRTPGALWKELRREKNHSFSD
uniref:Ig-like domain-containing protein n=1 Tax=Panthera leo TaxID=9689 RepID=A0A8C8X7V2_PANLE